MSGGDGKGHNSGAHDSGGSINGTSGKGGPDSGGGYWDNHPHITITGGREVGQGGAGINWGGGSGHGNGGGSVAIQEYNTSKYPNTGGFPPLGDASWLLNPPKWSVIEVKSENSAWRSYVTHVQGHVYKLTFDGTGKLIDTAYVNYEPSDDTRWSPLKSFKYNKGTAEKQVRDAINNEKEAVKDAVKFTADFYKEVFKVYGEKAEKLAKLLADQAKGKKVRNVEDALKSYEKYKTNINKKINAKDREAIAKALESMDVGKAAKNIAKFSKGLGWVGPAIDITDWFTELYKAVETDNWRSFYVKTETIAVGLAATHVAALAFSAVLGGPVGILGYGLIMAGVGALVNETIVDEANKVIGL